MKKLMMAGIIMLLILPGGIRAEEGQKEVIALEEVVVTATRTESTLQQIGGSSVTVITAQDIEAKKQITVEEILKGAPGIDVAATGGLGTTTTVFMRGADSKNTLILLDGIIFNDPSSPDRGADLANLTVDNIERIEIVRGPLSVLYGSNATAGVINIITKKGRGKPSVHAGLEGGSYNTWKYYGGASGALDKFNFSLTASRVDTDGFSVANDDNDRILDAGNTSEDDGWENTTVSAKLGVDITPDFDINAILRNLDSEVELDDWDFLGGYSGDRFDPVTSLPDPTGKKERKTTSDQSFGRINVHNHFFDRFFESNLYYQVSNQKREDFDNDGTRSYDHDGETWELGWQGGLNFDDINILSFGATHFNETMDSDSSNIHDKDADTRSLWAHDQLFLGDSLVLVGGVRHDDHDRFGGKTTYRFAPAYTITETQTTFKASYGTGFRAPSLFELYSAYGSETLKPEESEGWDMGFEQGLMDKKIRFGLTYFSTTYTDLIDYDMATWKYTQLPGETKTKGIEAFVGWTPVSDLDVLLNYTYNDTEDPEGERLVRRPLNKIYLNARYRPIMKVLLNIDLYWVDDRKAISAAGDKDGNPVYKLDSYALVNLSAYYDISNYVQVYARIDNFFDEEYEEAWSYATPGLSGYLGIKLSY
jgi:vitamin B12 transporter